MSTTLLFGKVPLQPLPSEYCYAHSSLCLLDAIYSINAQYRSVHTDDGGGVVGRYCRYFGLDQFKSGQAGEETLSILRNRLTERGPQLFAKEVVSNQSKAGRGEPLLKSVVVAQVADWLMRAQGVDGIESLRNWANRSDPEQVEVALKAEGIRGVGSTTIKYLMMLAGHDGQIKPDRHIRAFVAGIVHHTVGAGEATEVLLQEAKRVRRTPKEVDHSIWVYQKDRNRS